MDCQFFSPKKGASDTYVDKYFKLSHEASIGKSTSLVVPDCTTGIVYIERGSLSRKQDTFKEGDIFIFGQKTRSVEYIFEEDTQMYGCKLSPTALHQVFGIYAHEITDSFVNLGLILPGMDRLKEHLLLGELSPELHMQEAKAPIIDLLLDYIHQTKGLVSIQELSTRFNVGYKKMERLFKKHVGITPKLYARIIRFNQTFKISEEQKNLTSLAYESGFFDQNHFIKEIKRFTQKAPSELYSNLSSSYDIMHLNYLKSRAY